MPALDPALRAVLELRHALADGPPLTTPQISDRLGITQQMVRRRERSALRALRAGGSAGG